MGALSVYRKSSFAPAFLCLAPRRRRALAAVYAFARTVDDIVDEIGVDGGDPAAARRALEAWRGALASETPPAGVDPAVHRGLSAALAAFPIDRRHLRALIDGVGRDLDQARYAAAGDVDGYCDGVASSVGLACLPIFGLDEPRHHDFAVCLGRAVQWVNILRDVKTDALRGRLYLPTEDMKRFRVAEEEILGLVHSDRLEALLAHAAARAREYFDRAEKALPTASRGAARPALVMGRLYRRLLDKLERGGHRVFAERPRLSFLEKIGCLVF